MQYNWPIIGEKLYSILKGSSKKIIMYDAKGNETIDPESATRFFATYKSNDKDLDTFTILVAMHQQGHTSHIDIKTPNFKDTDDFETIHTIRNHIRRSIGEREGIKINWQVFDHAINPREEAMHNKKDLNESLRGFFTNLKNKIFRRSDRSDIMKFTLPGTSDGTVFSCEVLPNGNVKWIPHNRESFLDAEKELLLAQAREDGLYAHVDSDGSIIWRSAHTIKENIPTKKIVDKSIAESKDVSKVYGTTKSSFQRIGEAKLIIRHSAAVNEEKHGARSRYIRALFVENKNGERFAYPHLHVTGARAFARHISNGGTNHDNISEKLFSLSEDYIRLRKSTQSLRLTENVDTQWLTALRESMNGINRKLKSMHGPKGYKDIKETLLSENIVYDQSAIENLHNILAENCGCNKEDSLYNDLQTAARYIVVFKPEQTPLIFKWNSKPDLQQSSQKFDTVSQQLHWQLSELAKACENQEGATRLYSLAEMISNGIMPSEADQGIIRQAFKSNREFVIAETPVPEETELNEFLGKFSIDKIFEESQCNNTSEGEECPVHGLAECMSEDVVATENASIDEVSMSPDDPDDFGFDHEDDDRYDDDEEDPDYGNERDYDDYDDDRSEFADPGGHSALRAATPDNPRIHPCPTCGHPNRLTRADVSLGYQCDKCADATERGGEIDYYEDPDIDHDLEGEASPPEIDKDDLYESQVKRLKNLAGI